MGTEGGQHFCFPARSVEDGEFQAKAAAAKKAEEEALPLVSRYSGGTSRQGFGILMILNPGEQA